MSNKETKTGTATATEEKPGLFKRMIDKIDTAMKEKADAKASEDCCCGPDSKDEKGRKCC